MAQPVAITSIMARRATLCYFLQERGLLTKFYREFLSRATSDPTGIGDPEGNPWHRRYPCFFKSSGSSLCWNCGSR